MSHINFAVGLEVQKCLSYIRRLPLSTRPGYEHTYSSAIQEIASICSAQHCLSVTLRLVKQHKRNTKRAKFVPIVVDIAVPLHHSASSQSLKAIVLPYFLSCYAAICFPTYITTTLFGCSLLKLPVEVNRAVWHDAYVQVAVIIRDHKTTTYFLIIVWEAAPLHRQVDHQDMYCKTYATIVVF